MLGANPDRSLAFLIAARLTAVRRMLVLLGVSFREITLLVGLGVIAAIFEAVGIGLLIPGRGLTGAIPWKATDR